MIEYKLIYDQKDLIPTINKLKELNFEQQEEILSSNDDLLEVIINFYLDNDSYSADNRIQWAEMFLKYKIFPFNDNFVEYFLYLVKKHNFFRVSDDMNSDIRYFFISYLYRLSYENISELMRENPFLKEYMSIYFLNDNKFNNDNILNYVISELKTDELIVFIRHAKDKNTHIYQKAIKHFILRDNITPDRLDLIINLININDFTGDILHKVFSENMDFTSSRPILLYWSDDKEEWDPPKDYLGSDVLDKLENVNFNFHFNNDEALIIAVNSNYNVKEKIDFLVERGVIHSWNQAYSEAKPEIKEYMDTFNIFIKNMNQNNQNIDKDYKNNEDYENMHKNHQLTCEDYENMHKNHQLTDEDYENMYKNEVKQTEELYNKFYVQKKNNPHFRDDQLLRDIIHKIENLNDKFSKDMILKLISLPLNFGERQIIVNDLYNIIYILDDYFGSYNTLTDKEKELYDLYIDGSIIPPYYINKIFIEEYIANLESRLDKEIIAKIIFIDTEYHFNYDISEFLSLYAEYTKYLTLQFLYDIGLESDSELVEYAKTITPSGEKINLLAKIKHANISTENTSWIRMLEDDLKMAEIDSNVADNLVNSARKNDFVSVKSILEETNKDQLAKIRNALQNCIQRNKNTIDRINNSDEEELGGVDNLIKEFIDKKMENPTQDFSELVSKIVVTLCYGHYAQNPMKIDKENFTQEKIYTKITDIIKLMSFKERQKLLNLRNMLIFIIEGYLKSIKFLSESNKEQLYNLYFENEIIPFKFIDKKADSVKEYILDLESKLDKETIAKLIFIDLESYSKDYICEFLKLYPQYDNYVNLEFLYHIELEYDTKLVGLATLSIEKTFKLLKKIKDAPKSEFNTSWINMLEFSLFEVKLSIPHLNKLIYHNVDIDEYSDVLSEKIFCYNYEGDMTELLNYLKKLNFNFGENALFNSVINPFHTREKVKFLFDNDLIESWDRAYNLATDEIKAYMLMLKEEKQLQLNNLEKAYNRTINSIYHIKPETVMSVVDEMERNLRGTFSNLNIKNEEEDRTFIIGDFSAFQTKHTINNNSNITPRNETPNVSNNRVSNNRVSNNNINNRVSNNNINNRVNITFLSETPNVSNNLNNRVNNINVSNYRINSNINLNDTNTIVNTDNIGVEENIVLRNSRRRLAILGSHY